MKDKGFLIEKGCLFMLAKEIKECKDCPLYQYSCFGNWRSGGGGTPIEPPCCSWEDDDEIYTGMYDYDGSIYF